MRFGRGTLGTCLARVEAEAEGGDSDGLVCPAARPSRLNSQSEALSLSSGRREDLWPHQVLPDSENLGEETQLSPGRDWPAGGRRAADSRGRRPQGERGAWGAPLPRDPSRVREAPRPLCGCWGARPRRPGDQRIHLAGAEAPAQQ